jgi:hypothetical protein
MMGRPLVVCDTPELSTELAGLAAELDLELELVVAEGAAAFSEPRAEMVCVAAMPRAERLLELARRKAPPILVSFEGDVRTELLALELGIGACGDLATGVAALRLEREGVDNPSSLSLRSLSPLTRKRLGLAGGRSSARLESEGDGRLALVRGDGAPLLLGRVPEIAAAARLLTARRSRPRPPMPVVEGADRRTVLDVILGPARGLSDPASKSVLFAYGLTLPVEELCASPSRAAAEATRIGFPVRIALASPDLRASEHPDLHVDGVDSAARVREIYRQMMTLAASRREDARLLGVTVSASTTARAMLSVRVACLGDDAVVVDFAFADPHGAAAHDAALVVLPTDPEGLERALTRLAGHALLFGETPGEKRNFISSFAEILFRLAALARDFPDEIGEIELPRLAVLPGGELEIREARIEIGDAFSRQLGASS